MLKILGGIFQRIGLVLPVFAILLELNRAISLGQMLAMLLAAVCLFWIGRILDGYGSPST